MMASESQTNEGKPAHSLPLESFRILTHTYKTVHGQPILLDILVPKTLPSGAHPVAIRYHGGYLVCGSRNSLELTPPRTLQHALRENIILISCDYRLLPESNGKEILEDIEDAWIWIHHNLKPSIAAMTSGQSTADLERILLTGESAGGYLAIQQALSHPAAVRAVIAAYPMIDMRSDHFCRDNPKTMGQYPQFDISVIDAHLANMPDGYQPTTRALGPLPIAMVQHGKYQSFLGDDPCLYPLERLEMDSQLASAIPFIWIFHGTNDTEVPIDGSTKFIEKLRAVNPMTPIRYRKLEGMEHGISSEVFVIESGEWEAGLQDVQSHWFK